MLMTASPKDRSTEARRAQRSVIRELTWTAEEAGCERGQCQCQGMRAAMQGQRRSLDTAEISHAAATVITGIAVENLLPEPAAGRANTVVVPRHRSEVARDEDNGSARPAFADQADDAAFRIAAIDPFKTCGVAIHFVQGRFASVEPVKIADPALETGVMGIGEEIPLERGVMR